MLRSWPGSSGEKGAAFPLSEARWEAGRLLRHFTSGRTVVLLGLRTSAAFGVKAKFFEPTTMMGATVYVVPHPSGVNRWYNDAMNVRRMTEFMTRIARSR